jgi:hypothetical protein
VTELRGQKFLEWAINAKPGDRFEYHRGENLKACSYADVVSRAAYQGIVFLCQKRVGRGDFIYLAVRISAKTAKKVAPEDWENG